MRMPFIRQGPRENGHHWHPFLSEAITRDTETLPRLRKTTSGRLSVASSQGLRIPAKEARLHDRTALAGINSRLNRTHWWPYENRETDTGPPDCQSLAAQLFDSWEHNQIGHSRIVLINFAFWTLFLACHRARRRHHLHPTRPTD
jgi:hypothetical protein